MVLILALAISGLSALGWFYASSKSAQATAQSISQLATEKIQPPKMEEVLTKHSGRPPKAEFGQTQAETESQEKQIRRRIREGSRKNYYKKQIVDPGTKEVNGQAETMLFSFIDEVTLLKPGQKPDPPGLPVSNTAVLIGTVISVKAVVSQDKTFVYSDYQTRIDEVLKADPNVNISADELITTWRLGGSLRFPSGHIKHFVIAGRGFPEVGIQYLFFLRRLDPRMDAYEIMRAYALKDDVVLPLDDLGSFPGGQETMKKDEFLNLVRSAISTQKAGGVQ